MIYESSRQDPHCWIPGPAPSLLFPATASKEPDNIACASGRLHLTNLLGQSGTGKMKWIVYILECSDNSLYTGITNDLERRLKEHRTGRGAKYTKHRSPLRVRYTEYRDSKSAALTREATIKSLARSEKLALIAAQPKTKLHG
jgi:putative endonuclease